MPGQPYTIKRVLRINLNVPNISFNVNRGYTSNAWDFLGWLAVFTMYLWITILAVMLMVFWGHCLEQNLKQPKSAQSNDNRSIFIRDCERAGGVPTITPGNLSDYNCQQLAK